MTVDEGQEDGGATRSRRRIPYAPLLVTAGVGALALAGIWVARAPIAENLIARELAARNVRMRYRVASIGPRTQRIENIVLGDPRRPDLTARWVEVDIALGGFMPSVSAVRVGGVRMRASYLGGKLSLGELDKFMGQGGSTETTLPDIAVHFSDTQVAALTDYGPLGIVLGGGGNLRDGFDGRAVMAMPRAQAAGCDARRMFADLRIRMQGGAPRIAGPLTADALACRDAGVAIAAPHVDVDATLDSRLARVTGKAQLTASAVRAAAMTLGKLTGTLSLRAGDGAIAGDARIGGGTLSGKGFAMGPGEIKARFARPANGTATVDGRVTLANAALRGRDPMAGLADSAAGTPFAPLAAKLAGAVRDAGGDNRLSAAFGVRVSGKTMQASLSDLNFAAGSGAHIAMPAGSRAELRWPDGRWRFAGSVTLGGGGLPEGALTLDRAASGGVSGRLVMQPYVAGTARLALAPVTFSATAGGGSRFATAMTLDGPLADGGVRGLSLPLSGIVSASGALALNDRCVPVGWQSLRVSSLSLDPARLSLCPAAGGSMLRYADGKLAGGIQTRAVALGGRIGNSPLNLRAADLSADLSQPGFRLRDIAVRVGADDAPVILGAASLDGSADQRGFTGMFAKGHGRIGAVPFDLSEMDGQWRFAGGKLSVDGAVRIADTQAAARFNPLLAPDAHLTLENGRIAVTGQLRHPTQGDPFVRVEMAHDLSSGAGNAQFALTDMHFGPKLQPDDLTPMALGVVANVDGRVTGQGQVRWTADSITSDGQFTTKDMNLAAAFGPVERLTTTISFTDLIGLESAPGQVATIGTVNPGVLVSDGRILFQLLKGAKARIEGGEWPFAGGRLTLLPSTMDFDAMGARRLIFRVTSLDAGAFINTMELKNLAATGTYDGLLPMVFDASGGRIEGGILVARQEGMPPLVVESAQNLTTPCDPMRQAGTLSYVGEVSNAEMGIYGKMAFDALKKLRYKCLTILLDGAIDGEFLTRIAVNGINQGSEESRKSILLRPFLGLPFIFNVRIEAPFRGLLNTYQSFVDPSALVRGSLGPQFQSVLENGLAVQPADSENGANRNHE